jgi:hypothetical protein
MSDAPHDDTARLRFYERLGDAELFLLLESEATGDDVSPRIFDSDDERLVLVFDREDRLADFAGSVPYVSLSGRVLSDLLAEQGIGLALNPEVAPSSFVLGADGVRWLAETLAHAPQEAEAHFEEFAPPTGLPDVLLQALDQKLATATGLAQAAFLVSTRSPTGAKGHLLGFLGAVPGAQTALAKAVGEALTFSGVEAGMLDVAFFDGASAAAQKLGRVGLRFDLPQPHEPLRTGAPGRDPEAPPKLR